MNTIQGRAGGEVATTTVRLPKKLRDEVKIQAIRAGRSFNTHVAMILMEATGVEFGDHAPAARKTEENPNHQEATSHDGDDSAIRV